MVVRVAHTCLLGVVLSVLSGCGFWGDSQKEAPKKEASASKTQLLVLNVLSPELYQDAHIKGSVNVDLPELDEKAVQGWDKNTLVVVYCSNYRCSASKGGARILRKLGFTNVKAYEGGMAEWYQLSQKDPSYGVEGAAKSDYLSLANPKPAAHEDDIPVVTAQELRDLLQGAGL